MGKIALCRLKAIPWISSVLRRAGTLGSGQRKGLTSVQASPAEFGGIVASPSVRGSAMAAKNQQQVWNDVDKSKRAMAETLVVNGAREAAPEVNSTSSYARVMENKDVQKQVDAVAAPAQRDYESVIHQLRDKNAVGVVVAINGEIVWADICEYPATAKILAETRPVVCERGGNNPV